MTSGTNRGASGKRVNLPVVASTLPRRRNPSRSGHSVYQSGRWYQMKKSPCRHAMMQMSSSGRRRDIASDCIVSRDQLAVDVIDVVTKTIDPIPRQHRLSSAFAHRPPQWAIAEQHDQMLSDLRRIAGRREQTGDAVLDDVADAAHVGADRGNARREAF